MERRLAAHAKDHSAEHIQKMKADIQSGMTFKRDVFKASCNVEPTGCTVAWLLLVLSTMVHVVRCVYCGDDDCESDDDVGPETMYS